MPRYPVSQRYVLNEAFKQINNLLEMTQKAPRDQVHERLDMLEAKVAEVHDFAMTIAIPSPGFTRQQRDGFIAHLEDPQKSGKAIDSMKNYASRELSLLRIADISQGGTTQSELVEDVMRGLARPLQACSDFEDAAQQIVSDWPSDAPRQFCADQIHTIMREVCSLDGVVPENHEIAQEERVVLASIQDALGREGYEPLPDLDDDPEP